MEQLSPVMYNIKFEDGYLTKRHVNQIIRTQLSLIPGRGESIGNGIPVDNNNVDNERIEGEPKNSGKGSSESPRAIESDKAKRRAKQDASYNAPRRSPRLANRQLRN